VTAGFLACGSLLVAPPSQNIKVPVEFLGTGSPLTVARAASDLAKYLLAAPYSLYPKRGHRHPKTYRAGFRKTSAFLRFGSRMKLPGTEIGYCVTGGSLQPVNWNLEFMSDGPTFDNHFRAHLLELFQWRRDVRRFADTPVSENLLNDLIAQAALAPSVGNSQPWRFVKVSDPDRRNGIIEDFQICNQEALDNYQGEQARIYASLKLSGLRDAPAHLAVFADTETSVGHGLGQRTMPETLKFSVVGAINHLWLVARAHGVGMGWVSILNPDNVGKILDVPEGWSLVAYLCIGYPVEEHLDPELVRADWQQRLDVSSLILER
jgi:5,6-dimethylbenzimidazole synthase